MKAPLSIVKIIESATFDYQDKRKYRFRLSWLFCRINRCVFTKHREMTLALVLSMCGLCCYNVLQRRRSRGSISLVKILFAIRSIGFGGAENHVLSLMEGLRELGHTVLLVCPAGSWVSERCRERGLEVRHVAMRGMLDLISYWKLRRVIKTWRPDVVHAHQVRPSQYAGIAAIGTGVPVVSTAHSTGAHKHMRRMRHIIAVSDAVAENLVRHGYPPERVTRVHNGVADVPAGDRAAVRKELGIADGQFALVCAGRFNRQKGQLTLVAAVKLCPAHVHAHFIGDASTPYGREVVAAADGAAADGAGAAQIHFHGYRGDVPRLLAAFDVCASPSNQEAFSLSLAEAAAARLPVVATRVGGVPEVVAEGETGLLVAPGQPEAFAAAVMKLAGDPALAAKMAECARERYERFFSQGKMVVQTVGVYEEVLKGGGVSP
jgi:glycosyltransferase involved in cell wall biosynthesis